jgi:CRISPR-associated protein Csd1
MNWIETLYRTYENCAGSVGDPTELEPLLPLSHTTQNAQIEVTLDGKSNFLRAKVLQKKEQRTIVPCTESSGGRAGSKPTCHPLCDKLQYLAGDFLDYGGVVTSGFSCDPKEPHNIYVSLISAWCQSEFGNHKVKSVLGYVRKGCMVSDLVKAKILHCAPDSKTLLPVWNDPRNAPPEIYAAMAATSMPQDSFIRWAVEIPGDNESLLYSDPAVWKSWSDFYISQQAAPGFCYVTGVDVPLAIQHPAKLRHAADKAKLISSNDSSGFTFRGRFTDPEGSQVCGVSFDVTQKAHNALRWLIARQGRRDGDQAIVAWAVSGKDVPPIVADTFSLLSEEDDYVAPEADEASSEPTHAEVAQDFALRLKQKIGGYQTELGTAEKIVVLALDSATPGRMSMTYYRELASSEFLQRLERWHTECAWFQNFGQKRHFIGAASPKDIAICAYGTRLDDKLLAACHRRLLPCIIESAPLPRDIVENCIRRATARMSMEHWEWEKCLGIACSLYRKQQNDLQLHQHPMALERDRKTRDYLYGRLLAIADRIESSAMTANEKRDSNAARFMQRFADHPFTTWRTIELSLVPYEQRLRANAPGLLTFFNKERTEVMELFTADQFEKDGKLSGEFLLAYHSQSAALWKKQPKDADEDTNESSTPES